MANGFVIHVDVMRIELAQRVVKLLDEMINDKEMPECVRSRYLDKVSDIIKEANE